jgi:hypothetical protein
MMRAGIDQGLALGAGTRRRDYRRADHSRNLEGSKADAAGGSSDDDEIPLAELRLLHQRTQAVTYCIHTAAASSNDSAAGC